MVRPLEPLLPTKRPAHLGGGWSLRCLYCGRQPGCMAVVCPGCHAPVRVRREFDEWEWSADGERLVRASPIIDGEVR